MTITRDPGCPPEVAQLMSAFNRAADGSAAITVLNASINMLVACAGFIAHQNGMTREEAEEYLEEIAALLLVSVRENWNRKSSPTDIAVKSQ
jgi:hypothetical protein